MEVRGGNKAVPETNGKKKGEERKRGAALPGRAAEVVHL